MRTQGVLAKNDCGRWEFGHIELTSGCVVEICIDGIWLRGLIESIAGKYYWFSIRDGITVILQSGIHARTQRYY